LDRSDRQAAYQALALALDELGDGVTLVWRRPQRGLVGKIKPVSAFRDDKGRVCRHVFYSLSLGTYEKAIEGNVCREPNGSWTLAG
jgi:surface antigen